MTATFGHTSILLALLFAAWGIISPILGSRGNHQRYSALTRTAILAQFVLVTLAAVSLIYALVTTDFSIRYVAFNTTRATPIYYRVTGLWGALEGSLLLWEWILIIFSGLVAWIYRHRQRETMPWVLMVFSIVSAFFLGVIAFVSNPFETISPVPADGRGLNPLLEDANMMTHPPLLYTGFVGLTVPYAFAMAALIRGKVDEAWIVATRRWTIIAWFFLTAGNLVGAWWSYHVLGWGGYWAWDPVENAAFMPWLPATAFLHSVQVQERRRMLKVWNLSLIIIAFSLTIFGTFLTRSGILSSIHAFSSGPVGGVFLVFLVVRFAQFLRSPGVPGGSPQRATRTGFDGQPGVGFSVEQYRSRVGAFYDFPRDNFSFALGGDCRHAGQRWRALFQLGHGAFISSLGLSYGCGAYDCLAPGFLGQP